MTLEQHPAPSTGEQPVAHTRRQRGRHVLPQRAARRDRSRLGRQIGTVLVRAGVVAGLGGAALGSVAVIGNSAPPAVSARVETPPQLSAAILNPAGDGAGAQDATISGDTASSGAAADDGSVDAGTSGGGTDAASTASGTAGSGTGEGRGESAARTEGKLQPAATGPQPATALIDPSWITETSAATGIPQRALLAYAAADVVVDAEQPDCEIGWNSLAGVGAIESHHGSYGGSTLGENGYPEPAIRGIPLDGNGVAAISDTDGGAFDGDSVWDRAVGPMQFIPGTWEQWGADGNGDGVADPNQIDDAALAAARYLCASGPVTTTDGWRGAVLSYNRSNEYVDNVAVAANRYARAVGAGS